MAEPIPSPHLMILAAGLSSRMKRPAATEDVSDPALHDAVNRPKSMIRLGISDRPFMDYLLFNARAAGYRDVVLVISDRDSLVREYYGPGDDGNSFHGLTVSYATQRIPEGRAKPLGTADAVLCGALSRPDWRGSRFTVCNSDNIYSTGAMRTLLHSSHPNALIAYDTRGLRFTKEQEYNNALLEKDEKGFLRSIVEKPGAEFFERGRSVAGAVEVSMNIFRFSYDTVLPFLLSTPLHAIRQEKEIPATIALMIASNPGAVFCHSRREYVPDLTSQHDIAKVKEWMARNFSGNLFEE